MLYDRIKIKHTNLSPLKNFYSMRSYLLLKYKYLTLSVKNSSPINWRGYFTGKVISILIFYKIRIDINLNTLVV